MPDKNKKPADQLTNDEIAKRLFSPQVVQKIKEIEREKETKKPRP